MKIDLDDVDIAVVASIGVLREVLKKMSADGRTWWIACEPEHVLQGGYVTIGYGDPGCADRLNTIYYRLPILNSERPTGGADKAVVLLDSSVIRAEQPGLYRDDDRVVEDELADHEDFFVPLNRSMVAALAEYCGAAQHSQ